MEIKPIAYFRSPFSSKFGIPKQAGLVAELEGQIVFEPEFRNPDALRGMDIAITTTAKTDAEAKALLEAFKFPFRN